MPRKVNRVGADGEATGEVEQQEPAVNGGEMGVLPPAEMKTTINMPGQTAGSAFRETPEVDAPKVVRYRVLNQQNYNGVFGISILYNGCKTILQTGKLIDDVNFDIELLKRQGVRLEAIEV